MKIKHTAFLPLALFPLMACYCAPPKIPAPGNDPVQTPDTMVVVSKYEVPPGPVDCTIYTCKD